MKFNYFVSTTLLILTITLSSYAQPFINEVKIEASNNTTRVYLNGTNIELSSGYPSSGGEFWLCRPCETGSFIPFDRSLEGNNTRLSGTINGIPHNNLYAMFSMQIVAEPTKIPRNWKKKIWANAGATVTIARVALWDDQLNIGNLDKAIFIQHDVKLKGTVSTNLSMRHDSSLNKKLYTDTFSIYSFNTK